MRTTASSSTTRIRRPAPCGGWLSTRGASWPVVVTGARGGGKRRQIAVEGAALAGLARDLDVTAALLDDPVGAREPQAGALADALRREERLEDPVGHSRCHPATRVLDGEDDVRAGREIAEIVGEDLGVASPDRQRAAVGHRVARVQGEVEQHLLHLAGIGLNRIQPGLEHRHQLDPLAEDTAQHLDGLGDERVQLERPRLEGLAPAEREQLSGQRGSAACTRFDAAQMTRRGAVRVDLRLRELRVAEHAEEKVVEVVRDPRRQLADRLDLLRLTELFLGGAAVGDVLGHRDGALRLPVGVAKQRRRRVDPDDVTVLGVEPVLVAVRVVLSLEHGREEPRPPRGRPRARCTRAGSGSRAPPRSGR